MILITAGYLNTNYSTGVILSVYLIIHP